MCTAIINLNIAPKFGYKNNSLYWVLLIIMQLE